MKRLSLLLLLICIAAGAQTMPGLTGFSIGGQQQGVTLPSGSLPSWLNSDWAMLTNGVNSYADIPTTVNMASKAEATFMGWVKVNSVAAATAIWSESNATTNAGRLSIWLQTDKGIYAYGRNNVPTLYTTTPVYTMPLATWVHLAEVWKSDGLYLYVNGVQVSSYVGSIGTFSVNTPYQCTIGTSESSSKATAGIAVAEHSRWSRALSQQEIQRYMPKRLKGTEPGLVALYHLNDNSQTLVDSVGGRNAVASNSVAWTKRAGYAATDVRSSQYCLSFDAVDDYASATVAVPPISGFPFTMSGWFWHRPAVSSYSPILSLVSSTTGKGVNIHLYENNSTDKTIAYALVSSETSPYLFESCFATIGTMSLMLGRWTHITGVFVSSQSKLIYINGVLSSTSGTTVYSFPTGLDTVQLGRTRSAIGGGSLGTGKICEASIWNRALTATECAALPYSQLTGNESGLVFYVRGNEGTGTTLTDLSPTGKNMTLYNGPAWVGRDIP